jgi:hypothetical protein
MGQPHDGDVAGLARGLTADHAEHLLGDHLEPRVGKAEADEHQLLLGPQLVDDPVQQVARLVGLPVLASAQHDRVASFEDPMGVQHRAAGGLAERLAVSQSRSPSSRQVAYPVATTSGRSTRRASSSPGS